MLGNEGDELELPRVRTVLLYSLLQNEKLDEAHYMSIFKAYLEHGAKYIDLSYEEHVIDGLKTSWTRTKSDAFLLCMKAALNYDNTSPEYVRLLRLAVREDESMKKGIELLLDEITSHIAPEQTLDELEKHKETILATIKEAINAGNFDVATTLITEYENIVGLDAPICSAKAIVLMVEGRFDDAENVILDGLKIYAKNSDLLYNAGYLYEVQGKPLQALAYYEKAKQYTDDLKLIKEAKEAIDRCQVSSSSKYSGQEEIEKEQELTSVSELLMKKYFAKENKK